MQVTSMYNFTHICTALF